MLGLNTARGLRRMAFGPAAAAKQLSPSAAKGGMISTGPLAPLAKLLGSYGGVTSETGGPRLGLLFGSANPYPNPNPNPNPNLNPNPNPNANP